MVISCKNLSRKIVGEFIDLLGSSELLEKLPLQENDCGDLRHSRLEITNSSRCYATRLYVAGFFLFVCHWRIARKNRAGNMWNTEDTCSAPMLLLPLKTWEQHCLVTSGAFIYPSGYFLFWLYLEGCNWNEYIWVSKREISSFINLQLNYLLLILICLLIALRKKYEFYHPVSGPSYIITRRHVRCREGRIGSTKARIRKYSRIGCNTVSLS